MNNPASLLAPSVIARCPVVAVVRLATWPGELPVKVVAITRDENRYNVHLASLVDEEAGEWEASYGHYDLTWQRALEIMVLRSRDVGPTNLPSPGPTVARPRDEGHER